MSLPSYSAPEHFACASAVWSAYFDGRISSRAREEALAPLRSRLRALDSPSLRPEPVVVRPERWSSL